MLLPHVCADRRGQNDDRGGGHNREEQREDQRREAATYQLAAAYYRQERSDEAFRVLQELLRGPMDRPAADTFVDEGLYLLHEIRLAQDRCQNAIETLQLLKRNFPRSQSARRAQRQLRRLQRRCRNN